MAGQSTGWWDTVLGVVGFERVPTIVKTAIPVTASGLPSLNGGKELCEVWRVSGAGVSLSDGRSGDGAVRYRYDHEVLFGFIAIDEHRLDAAQAGAEPLLMATQQAYQQIFASLAQTGHRHLVRTWNYLPDITGRADGDERYRHFNSARLSAFRNAGRATMETVPAASALGSPSGSPLSIYFLASRRPPLMIENPRQTSAYHYPPKFGRHSPIFSRACVWGEGALARLFISGTASIVGHESVHPGDVAAQTRETLSNIGALLDEANKVAGASCYALDGLQFKVYVRRAVDLTTIKEVLAHCLSPATVVVYVLADICREDLLVEIEAVGEPQRYG